MDIIYFLPNQPHRIFINIVHACPNACFFCVDFKGNTFYGFDLTRGKSPTIEEIVAALQAYPFRSSVREIYYCGIGEPLLLYDHVLSSVHRVRECFQSDAVVAINTSGTFYLRHQRVDFADSFDLIQISLNAENEEKYNQICRPKVKGAYKALMKFLADLRTHIDRTGANCRVELTIVDPEKVEHLPERERGMADIPRPDVEACKKIAKNLGWPLKVKTLIKDCENSEWQTFAGQFRH